MYQPEVVLDFWFSEPMKSHWFSSTPEIDTLIKDKFEFLWQYASGDNLVQWQDTPEGCLALCIVLDQFPLNMFRNQAVAFSTEQHAVMVAKHAIIEDFDQQIDKKQVAFLYMPLMHSENIDDQDLCVARFEAAGLEENSKFAKHHREIVRKYGRFPHRNALLGRHSSPEEIEYLNSKDAFTG